MGAGRQARLRLCNLYDVCCMGKVGGLDEQQADVVAIYCIGEADLKRRLASWGIAQGAKIY